MQTKHWFSASETDIKSTGRLRPHNHDSGIFPFADTIFLYLYSSSMKISFFFFLANILVITVTLAFTKVRDSFIVSRGEYTNCIFWIAILQTPLSF